MLFDQKRPEDEEPRGTLFGVDLLPGNRCKLVFGGEEVGRRGSGARAPDRVWVGDVVFKTRDAELGRRLKRIAEQDRKLPITVAVRGTLGQPLEVVATDALGRTAQVTTDARLVAAERSPLDAALLRDKLCAFGDTTSLHSPNCRSIWVNR